MADVLPASGSISGVAATDLVQLQYSEHAAVKRVTVEELLRGTGIAACGPVWDDLRFPAQSINPPGSLDGPTVDSTETGFPGTLLFSGTQDRIICGVLQMPHSWLRGTDIKPHIHWTKPTGSASAVTWELFVRILGNGGDAPQAWSAALPGTIVAGNQTVSDQQLITSFGPVAMAGLHESAMMAWRIYRRGSTDADNNEVRLLEFDVHFQINQLGTIPEFPT